MQHFDLEHLLMVCKHNSSEVARRMGVSPQAVSMWRLRGKIPKAQVERAKAVVAAAVQSQG